MDIKICDFCDKQFIFSSRYNTYIEKTPDNMLNKSNVLNRFSTIRRSILNKNEFTVDICDECFKKLFNKEHGLNEYL